MVCQPVYTQLAYIQPVYTWSVYTRSVYTRPVYKWSLYTGLSTLGLSIPALLSTHRLLCMWESRPSQPGAEMFLRCGYSSSSSPKPVPRGKKEGMGSALLGLHSALSEEPGNPQSNARPYFCWHRVRHTGPRQGASPDILFSTHTQETAQEALREMPAAGAALGRHSR